MTIREAYETSMEYLVTEARLDKMEAHIRARLLVDHLSGVRFAHLMQPNATLQPDQEATLHAAMYEVARGCPLSYITKKREFFGLSLYCDKRALIPRSETEVLVEAAIRRLKDRPRAMVADLGTGTGCLAVSIAHALPDATIYATDVNHDTLDLARKNAEQHGVAERIYFVAGDAGDWAAPLLRAGRTKKFDVVLSNPPYIATEEIEKLPPEIRDWEPRVALDGGLDGLAAYRQIAAQTAVLLRPGGLLMVELGAGQYDAVRAIFSAAGWSVEPPIFDLAGIARVLMAH